MIPENEWTEILERENLLEISFILNEIRDEAKEQLPLAQEILLNDLAVDGYHGWGEMYDSIVGNMKIELKEDGVINSYSVGQASNKLNDPNRNVRKQAFEKLEQAWTTQVPLFAQTLNHLAGFRLQTYKHKKWDNVLKEPLEINRMQEATLDAMWGVITDNKQPFIDYLNRKAQLLNIDRLSIYDIEAPLTESVKEVSYEEAAEFIIKHFKEFSPKLASFTEMAFDKRWIEAEDRDGKRPGGFCTSFPKKEETRIFMTYAGTSSSVATLAHELGHAYHQHVMNDIDGFNQGYAMNVAETASTFAEMIVADAAVKAAVDETEKISLLEDKIQSSVAFFMNIHSRFLFETRFYEERKSGLVSGTRLNELMEEAQREAYGDSITDYDPTFWASKLHFHITGVPFYNFPYTFGYLFSLGIYAHAQKQGTNFENDYIELLRDTGRMTTEQLAKKHLNVDLTKKTFWEQAIQLCVDDVNEFLELTK